MRWQIFPRWSLKARVTVFALAIFLVGIWSLAFFARQMLREDMQHVLGNQQLSTAAIVAENLNAELERQFAVLHKLAGQVSPATLGNTAAMQAFLDDRLAIQETFNGGVVAFRPDGVLFAEAPRSAGRVGLNSMGFDTIAAALKEGTSTVGQPMMGARPGAPVFGVTVPIRDARGKVIGALSGVTNLGTPNFLDKITGNHYGNTGGYLLIAPKPRRVVTATDKSRIMETLPAPGVSPWIDLVIQQGYEGTSVFVNPRGVEVLTSVKRVPAAGWIIVIAVPTAEAFAPIHSLQQHMLLATIILTLLAGTLIWWMVRRQLAPLSATARLLSARSQEDQLPQPLPITGQDEIGDVIFGFNRLLETLAQREEALRESELRWKLALEGSADGVWDWTCQENDGRFSVHWKDEPRDDQLIAMVTMHDFTTRLHPDDRAGVAKSWQDHVNGKTALYEYEYRLRCNDGSYKWFHTRGIAVKRGEDGNPVRMIGTYVDISKRKQIEAQLIASEKRYFSLFQDASDAIAISERNGDMEEVNRRFTLQFGYTKDELRGRPFERIYCDAELPKLRQYYEDLWHSALGPLNTTLRCKDGTEVDVEIHCTLVEIGGRTVALGIFNDLIERKRQEQQRLAKEKTHRDTLVREVHHRIKNNLQSVAGLLQRELGRFAELDPRLKTAIAQVNVIAVVHGLQSADPAESIRLDDVVRNICKTVSDLSGYPVVFHADQAPAPIRQLEIENEEAVSVALVLNELILNAVKHSPAGACAVTMLLKHNDTGMRIIVRNSLAGTPDFDIVSGKNLGTGLGLVRSLLPEQGADLKYEVDSDGFMVTTLQLSSPVMVATAEEEREPS